MLIQQFLHYQSINVMRIVVVGFVCLCWEFEDILYSRAVCLANFIITLRFACFISALNGTGMLRWSARTGD